MEKGLCLGLIIGAVLGCMICANSKKVRKTVLDAQEKINEKIQCKCDELKNENSEA